jgi:hypothetical protein
MLRRVEGLRNSGDAVHSHKNFIQNYLPVKKLLFLFFASWWRILSAQDADAQNSLAVVAGVNGFHQLSKVYVNADFSPRLGYSTGFEYTLEISKNWHFKARLCYAKLNYSIVAGPFIDPVFPTYVTIKGSDFVCQFSTGIRWLSKSATWRYYIDAEMGFTSSTNNVGFQEMPQGKMIPTLGVGFGLALQLPNPDIHIFAQPAVRYVFQSFQNDIFLNRFHFFMPAFEMGVRRYF